MLGRSPSLDLLPNEIGHAPSWLQNTRQVSIFSTPFAVVDQSPELTKKLEHLRRPLTLRRKIKSEEPESSNVNESGLPTEQPTQHPVLKRRKRHRRKHFENQEPCIMRGVYYKNMKWQAAIKVDKKQIHLGTVGSQEEAARLYDSDMKTEADQDMKTEADQGGNSFSGSNDAETSALND
ncbi:ethylene-responsive transcription factor-like protein isoform X1 [Tanacetum coccineum]